VVTSSLPDACVTGQYGDVFTFLAGRPCLDLTATLQVRHRDRPRELLAAPADVTAWIAEAGFGTGVDVGDAGLTRTRDLRECVYRLGRDARPPADRAELTAFAAAPPLVPAWTGDTVVWRGELSQVLSTLARDALDLFTGPLAGRVRECAHDDCSRLFVDASHAGRRRWCGMTACGAKAKSASYRRRRAAEPALG
jgi:predicted RNA-binding Zn ribbon-like protein